MEVDISNLVPLTYSMLITTDSTFNLKDLATNFPIDNTLPGFVSKSYFTNGWAYTFPPKGPIPIHFKCLYCKNKGPENHDIHCERPLNSSLILSETTDQYPGAKVGSAYDMIVVKSGQKKVSSKSSRNEIFYDVLQLFYENEDKTKTTIKVPSNGNINISFASFTNEALPEIIAKKLNINLVSKKKYFILAQFNIFPKSQNKTGLSI